MAPRHHNLLGRIGAHSLHAKYDPRETTRAARKAFLDTFEHQADPDGVLDPEERQRRAKHLRKAHFTRLALRSAQARRRRSTQDGRAK